MTGPDLQRSPIHTAHVSHGARFTDFGGWEMPLQYAGTLEEHRAVRAAVGVFDVSHLGRFLVSGPGARQLVGGLLCNDLDRIAPGRAQYTLMLDATGGIRDDIIVWWLDEERLLVLPNGVNHDIVRDAFSAAAPVGVAVTDLRPGTALFAVQGPTAPALLEQILGFAPKRFRVVERPPYVAAGTGYTGEPGAEVVVDADHAAGLFAALLQAGAAPCGLGARDVLRLEMGFPLWGQDIDAATTPLEAGLGWVIGWDHEFVGRSALAEQQKSGVDRTLIGFALPDRRVPRHGYPLRCAGSEGVVTSGNFSPSLGVGIGMGYVSPPPPEGVTETEVGIRGEWYTGRRVDPPFLER
ncbi:MAG TPA: glycine cleavage system aminomethyltransferase GcvT [Acidimicrobiia bacterium]|nr:glycine cleavage system aminomethyltransferase GcvT [Acidimicrobiia bacterium]